MCVCVYMYVCMCVRVCVYVYVCTCQVYCTKNIVIERAKRAPHWGVQTRFRVIYMCRYVCRVQKCVGGITWPKHALA